MKKVTSFAFAAAVALVSVSAFARPGVIDNKALIGPQSAGEVATSLSTGFEAPFVPGTIAGQQGWNVSTIGGVAVTSFNISNAGPLAGAQSLLVTDQTSVANDTLVGAFSPNVPQPAFDKSILNINYNISNTGGADYQLIAQSPTQALLSYRVLLSFTGDIFVVDFNSDPTPILAFIDTGVNWTAGVTQNLRVNFQPSGTGTGGSIVYSLDGTPIYTADSIVAGTAVDQVIVLHDNFQLAGETAKFDSLSITAVPEPTSLALLSLGGIAALRRRRA